ncbi:MAG: hydroxymethylpyrimidine/phosphomethylpyrimidine kinase [Bacteroidaceae bacterium]|nr:hydroxymethylpyrimidine/phosphomethylpyrimidine kinase [Bacteroidaceae bacterium]
MQKKSLNVVFLIAGSEPLGSAGMQADIKAITACGGYAACAVTSIVDEDTRRVKRIFHLPVDLIVSQAESFLGDIATGCIKTGVLPNEEIIRGVATVLRKYRHVPLIVDPVIVNSVGEKLVADNAIEAYKQELFPLATLITPNRREAEVLLGRPIRNVRADIKELGRWGCSVIIKSMEYGQMLSDFLYNAATDEVLEFAKPRIDTHNVNGTGDSFSSAIATYLAARYPLNEAVKAGEEFISRAISLGAEYEFGHGFGPVHPCFMEDKVAHQRIYNETN